MPLTFTDESSQQMHELHAELTTVLRRANDARVEAGIAAFACVRCARILLDLYPDTIRGELLEVVVAFLRREPAQGGSRLVLM